MRKLILMGCLYVFLCALPASAKVAAIPIQDLVTESDEIVLAAVTEVSAGSFKRRTPEPTSRPTEREPQPAKQTA